MKKPLVWIVIAFIGGCGQAAEQNYAGGQLYAQGEYRQSALAFYAAQVDQPDHFVLYFNASAPLIAEGSYEEAVAALEMSLQSGDAHLLAQSYYNLGNAYFQQSRYHEAVLAFRDALRLNPDDADTRYNLELAMLYDLPPTPTALEQKVEPSENNTDPNATPTPNPLDIDGPTPTPTPPDDIPPDPSQTPIIGIVGDFSGGTPGTPLPQTESTMSVEEAQRHLDSVKQDQRTLSEFRDIIITPENENTGKEW